MDQAQRKKLSDQATKLFKDVILDVLQEQAAGSGTCIGAAEISRRAHIDRLPAGAPGGTKNWNDGITYHVLNMMLKDKTVERCRLNKRHMGWKIAKEAEL